MRQYKKMGSTRQQRVDMALAELANSENPAKLSLVEGSVVRHRPSDHRTVRVSVSY